MENKIGAKMPKTPTIRGGPKGILSNKGNGENQRSVSEKMNKEKVQLQKVPRQVSFKPRTVSLSSDDSRVSTNSKNKDQEPDLYDWEKKAKKLMRDWCLSRGVDVMENYLTKAYLGENKTKPTFGTPGRHDSLQVTMTMHKLLPAFKSLDVLLSTKDFPPGQVIDLLKPWAGAYFVKISAEFWYLYVKATAILGDYDRAVGLLDRAVLLDAAPKGAMMRAYQTLAHMLLKKTKENVPIGNLGTEAAGDQGRPGPSNETDTGVDQNREIGGGDGADVEGERDEINLDEEVKEKENAFFDDVGQQNSETEDGGDTAATLFDADEEQQNATYDLLTDLVEPKMGVVQEEDEDEDLTEKQLDQFRQAPLDETEMQAPPVFPEDMQNVADIVLDEGTANQFHQAPLDEIEENMQAPPVVLEEVQNVPDIVLEGTFNDEPIAIAQGGALASASTPKKNRRVTGGLDQSVVFESSTKKFLVLKNKAVKKENAEGPVPEFCVTPVRRSTRKTAGDDKWMAYRNTIEVDTPGESMRVVKNKSVPPSHYRILVNGQIVSDLSGVQDGDDVSMFLEQIGGGGKRERKIAKIQQAPPNRSRLTALPPPPRLDYKMTQYQAYPGYEQQPQGQQLTNARLPLASVYLPPPRFPAYPQPLYGYPRPAIPPPPIYQQYVPRLAPTLHQPPRQKQPSRGRGQGQPPKD